MFYCTWRIQFIRYKCSKLFHFSQSDKKIIQRGHWHTEEWRKTNGNKQHQRTGSTIQEVLFKRVYNAYFHIFTDNVFTSGCQEFCSQGRQIPPRQTPYWADTHTPLDRHPPGQTSPLGRHIPPPGRHPPWADTDTPRQTAPSGQTLPRDGHCRHPPGRHPPGVLNFLARLWT